MNKPTLDYIIVGQGLAGSCFAWQLIRNNKSFVVFDRPGDNRCSVVAAGLFNPVTGQNLVKTWMYEKIFPYLYEFYQSVERATNSKFFHPLPMYRPFGTYEEQNEWMGRSVDNDYSSVLDRVERSSNVPGIKDHLGGIWLKDTGFINTVAFLHSTRNYLSERDQFISVKLNPHRLNLNENGVSYEGYEARRVVFCEGTKVVENPWFGKVNIKSLKGETLRIKSGWEKHVIVNRGVYMVPGSVPGEFRVGSTYNYKDHAEHVTEPGRIELENKLNLLIDFPYQIAEQSFGFRPAAPDRKPVLGAHPQFPQLAIFNGLGTKGVSLAPYFSELLFLSLETARPLNKEVDVTRFKVLY